MNGTNLRSSLRSAPIAVSLAVCLICSVAAYPARAAGILVTEFNDDLDDTNGTCTLREAIRSRNTGIDVDACQSFGSGAFEIRLSAGTYRLDLANGTAEDNGIDGDLDILNAMAIRGVSAEHTIIDGDATASQERVFDVVGNGNLRLSTLTVTGGHEPAEAGGNLRVIEDSELHATDVIVSDGKARIGGGIFADSSVFLSRAVIRDNVALGDDSFGGGIAFVNGTDLVVQDSSISGNQAAGGGGIIAIGGSLMVFDSSITGNVAANSGSQLAQGGGLAVAAGTTSRVQRARIENNQADRGAGVLWAGEISNTITHSAIVNNIATENGGGIYSAVDGFIRYSTVSGNSAASGGGVYSAAGMTLMDSITLANNTGGGVFNESGATFEYSLLAGNTGGNCLGTTPLANAYNLDDENTCAFPTNDPDKPSIVNTDPMLGPLQDNGGGLPTHALLPGSPAIDAYNSDDRTGCHEVPDQRTYSRGSPSVQNASNRLYFCDIGAFEFNLPFVVNSTDDTVDVDLADGICADLNGNCTLRAAVMQSDKVLHFNEIELGAGTYALTLAGAGEDFSLTGDLDIADDVLIRGQGVGETIIDGAGLDRLIGRPGGMMLSKDHPGADLIRLEDLTLQGGAADVGGAILGWKPLELERVALRGNAASAFGGAIHCVNSCELSIVDSSVDGNHASNNGGAIYYRSESPLMIEGTTVSNNSGNTGGAMEINGTLHARNSTFSGNTGDSSAVAFVSAVILENTTVTDNEAGSENGSFRIFDPSAIVNSVIANNRVNGVVKNCSIDTAALVSLGHNVTDTEAADCDFKDPSDLVETDPLLGPLTNNGGPTETHLPLAGSPLIDAGDNGRCTVTDQRGFARSGDCDIGSVETASADVALTLSAAPNPVVQGSNTTITLRAANGGPGDATGIVATATLPAGLGFVSGTAGAANCSEAAGVVTCDLGGLLAGGDATATIVITASQTGALVVPVELSTTSADSDAANNSGELTVTVNAPAGGGGGGNTGGGGGGSLGLITLVALLFCIARQLPIRLRSINSAKRHGSKMVFAALAAMVFSPVLQAGPVPELVSFTAGTTARSAEVNGNFSAISAAVNDNDARIVAIETEDPIARIEALEAEIADLHAALANVLQINQYLSLETVNDQPAVRITGANLQLVNGLGETATTNGTGNLLVGYDEVTDSTAPICSNGQFLGEATCISNAEVWAPRHKSGSHSVIVGPQHNYSTFGALVAGHQNSVNRESSSVVGGFANRATGQSSSVGGGQENEASGFRSHVSGGENNTANARVSSVTGGSFNVASNLASSVSGGFLNTASGVRSSVSGGDSRSAVGDYDWVAGSLTEGF